MFAALVMIRCHPEKVSAAARAIVGFDGVAEVYSVTGEWDLVAAVRVAEFDGIAKVVTEGITRVEGLERTETLVAFRVLSKEDLDAAWAGFE